MYKNGEVRFGHRDVINYSRVITQSPQSGKIKPFN